jgi:hypothetical protein
VHQGPSFVGASLLAMVVNDNACRLNTRVAWAFFASKLAPTNLCLLLHEQSVALRTVAHDTLLFIFLKVSLLIFYTRLGYMNRTTGHSCFYFAAFIAAFHEM